MNPPFPSKETDSYWIENISHDPDDMEGPCSWQAMYKACRVVEIMAGGETE
jgi:hypothetical protein